MPRTFNNFHTFITNLIHTIDTNVVVSSECKAILDQLIKFLIHKYVSNSINLCKYANKITLDSKVIETITKIWLDDPRLVLDFAYLTWDVYTKNTQKGIKKHTKAGLILPPSRILKSFRDLKTADQKVGEPAYIFLTAIIEYIIKDIIRVAVVDDSKKTLSGKNIYHALHSKDLNYLQPLLSNVLIIGFGYI